MRNIKITALLLAVLMVVTAFAGCANNSELDNKVNDLDGKIQEQADALAGIQDSIKDLASALENQGSSSELDDIKADVEANKQNIADILEAINGLKDAVAGATGDSEDVKLAIAQAAATIGALKEEYADTKVHYSAEDRAAITVALNAAEAAISTCVTAEAVAAELAALEAALDACVRVDDSIYAYIVALTGNITAESAELAEEAKDALDAAKKFYTDAKMPTYLTDKEYEVAEDKKIALATELEKLLALQTGLKTTEGTLAWLTDWAETLVKNIDKAAEEFDEAKLATYYDSYREFVVAAKKLSEKNVALVTNVDTLLAALDSAENISSAKAALDKTAWKIKSLLTDTYVQVFADYNTLAATNAQVIFMTTVEVAGEDDVVFATIEIYDAIDAQLAELAKTYDLTDAALAFVVDGYAADKGWGAEFYARYEADKALVKKFAAEYETLAAGVFADIKALAASKLTAASAMDLVNKYTANRDAINAWAIGLVEAYAAEYKALEDKTTVNFVDIADAVEANFNVMANLAKLGDWSYDTAKAEWKYNGYSAGLNTAKTHYYYDLYAFDYYNNDKGAVGVLGEFLAEDYNDAVAAAEVINAAIKAFKVDQANSVLPLLIAVGGYYSTTVVEDDKVLLKPIEVVEGENPYVTNTIADFILKYKTENYDLSGMIDLALYNEKVAAVAAAVEAAETALKALDSAYKALLGENNNVIVTMDNADAIIALEALLIQAKAAANVEVVKAIALEDDVYEIKAIVADVLAEGETAAEYYNRVLLSTDYANTVAGSVETGAIVRLVYQAKALKKEAVIVESAYKVIKQLNDATGGKAFAYSTLNDAAALLTKLSAAEKDLSIDGYWYGIAGFDTATRTTSAGATLYTVTAKMVRFNKDTGFYMGSIPGAEKDNKNDAIRSAIVATRNQWAYTTDASAEALCTLLFTTIKNDVKTTDSEALSTIWGASNKFFPGYTLPMIATYLEAKFVINNMGKTTDAITAAKAGWGVDTSNYGYEYNKAMVANMLRVNANLDSAELTILGNAANYGALTRAITNINVARADANKITFDIAFGHADATWISDTYNLAKVDYAKGGALDAASTASTYEDHGIKLNELVVDLIFIWEAPELI